VPRGHQVAGMAHARIVVKQKPTRHRARHARKKVKAPTETAEPTSKP
jgi:hypothetical protein